MKKLYVYFITTIMILALVGCGTDNLSTTKKTNNSSINKKEEVLSDTQKEIEDFKTNYNESENLNNNITSSDKKELEENIEKESVDSKEETTSKNETVSNDTTETTSKEEVKPDYTIVDVSYTKYTNCCLNVRNYPGISGEQIGILDINTKVNVIGECNNGWLKISYKDMDAFVRALYLSDVETIIEKPEEVKDTKEEPTQESNNTVTVAKEGSYDYNLSKEAFDIANQIRINNGLSALTWDDALYESAKIRSAEASISWSHTRPDGSHWSTVSSVLHGENLAKGYNTAQEAVDAWMSSDGHKANILRKDFTRGAVAFFNTSNGWFWCQHFGY